MVKKGTLVLLELLCNILIFALCAAVCVGILGHAKTISEESATLTDAVLLAQSAAERNRAGLWDGDTVEDGYTVTLTPAAGGGKAAVITVSVGEKPVYTLTDKGVTADEKP
ncbi:MAG: hypothetical protein RR949_01260 [Oscillospiraceae bacterium]